MVLRDPNLPNLCCEVGRPPHGFFVFMELHGPLSICKMESQVREHPGSPKRKAKGSPSQIQKDIDIYIYIYIQYKQTTYASHVMSDGCPYCSKCLHCKCTVHVNLRSTEIQHFCSHHCISAQVSASPGFSLGFRVLPSMVAGRKRSSDTEADSSTPQKKRQQEEDKEEGRPAINNSPVPDAKSSSSNSADITVPNTPDLPSGPDIKPNSKDKDDKGTDLPPAPLIKPEGPANHDAGTHPPSGPVVTKPGNLDKGPANHADGTTAPLPPVTKPGNQGLKSDWARYYEFLVKYVIGNLQEELKRVGVDTTQYGKLHQIPPTSIERNTAVLMGTSGTQMTTFKETWNILRCKLSMDTTGKYAAAGTLWWFNLQLLQGGVIFNNSKLFDVSPHREGVEGASQMWNDAAFNASDLKPHRRRYDFLSVLPTACAGIPDVKQALQAEGQECTPTFHQLPLLAGHQMIIAYLEALVSCFSSDKEHDKERLRKLFEARDLTYGGQAWQITFAFSQLHILVA